MGFIAVYEFFFAPEHASSHAAFSSSAPATSLGTTPSINGSRKQPFLSRTAKLKSDAQHFATGPPGENGSPGTRPGSASSRNTTEIGADGRDEAVMEDDEGRERLERQVADLGERIAQLTALILADRGVDTAEDV